MLKRLLTALTLSFVLVGLISTVFAELTLALPNDGRINVVAHFGGDALYCVDENANPTNDFAAFSTGGFSLLDIGGQALWFVPAAQVAEAIEAARESGEGVLVASGSGTYGPVYLYTYVSGQDIITFVFTGVDEHGASNSLSFELCNAVGPATGSQGGSASLSDDTDEEFFCPIGEIYNPNTDQCENDSADSAGVMDIGPGISSDDGLPE